MSKDKSRYRAASRRKRTALFVSGVLFGSSLGLVLGMLLAFWVGEGAFRAVQNSIRRFGGDDGHPNFDLLLQ
jgi:hypothetical protein